VIREFFVASPLFHREGGNAGAKLPKRNIRDVLRLTAAGMSSRKIAASLSIGAASVIDCLRRARRPGLAWPLPDRLDDAILELRLYPPRPGVTLWHEYRDEHPSGYAYSRFCKKTSGAPSRAGRGR
jgi:hypothetical protein